MIKVVLDTNILVSGLLSTKGNPAKIVNAFMAKQFQLFYNVKIIEEYQEVLLRNKLGLRVEDVTELLDAVSIFGFIINPDKSDIHLPDESDRIFYDVAKASNAFLITGNIKHYPMESFIINPTQFVALLEN